MSQPMQLPATDTGAPRAGDEALARPLRFTVFGGSIVSEVENPAATTLRVILTELARQGHDAVFLEPRNNPTMQAMLRIRGSAGLRAFGERWPQVHYRSIDVPVGRGPDVWVASQLARLVATTDVVIVLDTAPSVIRAGIGRMTNPRLARIIYRTQDILPDEAGEYALQAEPLDGVVEGEPNPVVWLGPATSPASWMPEAAAGRSRDVAIVSYGGTDEGSLVWCVNDLSSKGYVVRKHLAIGSPPTSQWQPIVESELPDHLDDVGAVVVIPGGNDQHERALAQARAFVPLSYGKPTIALGPARDYPLLHNLGLLWEDHGLTPLDRPPHELRRELPSNLRADVQVNQLRQRVIELLRRQWQAPTLHG